MPGRLASMCRVRWLAYDHPAVTRGPWTEEERISLYRAVQDASRPAAQTVEGTSMDHDREEESNEIDWELVALFLGVSIRSDRISQKGSSIS